MKNKKIKDGKGITLIVWIITIIILLILVGITVIVLIYPNGILTNDLETNKQKGEIGTSGDGEVQTLLEMYKNAENCETVDCTDETHLHIGDYVEGYLPDNMDAEVEVGKEETGYEEENGEKQKYEVEENMTWRVLGLSEDEKHILLTSENPMRKTVIEDENPYLILQGAEAYIYCEDTLDKICSIYDNTELADEVRSIKIEDINRVLGVELGTDEDGNEIVYQKDESEKTNIDENGTLGEIYEYKEGDYAPENYVIDMAKKEGKSIVGITEKKAGDTIKGTAYYYDYYTNSQFNISQKAYDMLFQGTTGEENCSKAYWLASPSTTADSYVQYSVGFVGDNVVGDPSSYTGLEMFNSFGEWNAFSLAVRPVISLKSDVTEKEIRKAENQNPTVDEWTYINTEDMAEGTIEGEEGQIKVQLHDLIIP